jgi:hypothetical protein
MKRAASIQLLVLLLLSIATSCAPPPPQNPPPGTRSMQQLLAERKAMQLKLYPPPVVALWDNGDLRRNQPPTILFGLWTDGQVVRRLEGRLYIGRVSEEQARQLVQRIAFSGIRELPISSWVLYANNPTHMLWVDFGLTRIAMTLDMTATAQDLRLIPGDATPSRPDVEQFIEVWQKAQDAIREVWPARLDQTLFVTGLDYPDLTQLQTPPINAAPSTQPTTEPTSLPATNLPPTETSG